MHIYILPLLPHLGLDSLEADSLPVSCICIHAPYPHYQFELLHNLREIPKDIIARWTGTVYQG
jgi:hypothetical protein